MTLKKLHALSIISTIGLGSKAAVEVHISGLLKYKSHGGDSDLYGILATNYSLGPHQVLNWYFVEP